MGLIAPSFTFAGPQLDPMPQSITAATQIWIEPVKRADGRKHYTIGRGLLLAARLGNPDGEILIEATHNAVCEACRVLVSRGIVGSFETRKQVIPYPCMKGDIEKTAGLTVYEPDDVKDARPIHFRSWRPFDEAARRGNMQNALCSGTGFAPARVEDGPPARPRVLAREVRRLRGGVLSTA
jgi:hypothetical protein